MEIAEIDRVGSVVVRARRGDAHAFEALVAAYHPDVLRVCRLMCRRQQDAEDAAQAAWSRVWRKLDSLRDPARPKPWIVAIAANEARQQLRRERVRSLIVPRRAQPEAELATELLDLRTAFERLPADDRRLLALRHAAGLTSVELSEVLGASPGSIRVRLSRLHRILGRDVDHE